MIKILKKIFWTQFTAIDGKLKFPHLNAGDTGIQLGFDMSTPITSDLFTMYNRVAPSGKVIGIDPDPFNHKIAQGIIKKKGLNIQLIKKGTHAEEKSGELLLGERSSWNQLQIIPKDSTVKFKKEKLTVPIDTLDRILKEYDVELNRIKHINLTINGSEYHTLLGMKEILSNCEHLSLTIVAGRHDESGTIEGKRDYEMIIPLLQSFGFKTKFRRINELFWWGFMVKLLTNRKWIYNKPNFGIIIACKGSHQLKWYQSFS